MFSLPGRKNCHVKLGEKLLHPVSSYLSYKEPLKNYGHSYERQPNTGTMECFLTEAVSYRCS